MQNFTYKFSGLWLVGKTKPSSNNAVQLLLKLFLLKGRKKHPRTIV